MLAASVIIPCRGHSAMLARCLASVTAQERADFETIVVDAAFDDAVVEAAAPFPSVRVVRSIRPLYAGEARNLGARHARGAALVFIDADCTAEPDWLTAALCGLSKTPIAVGAVEDGAPWHPIAAVDNLMQFAELPAHRPAGPIVLLPGCNMAISVVDFESLGGFPAVALSGEDGLLAVRAIERWPRAIRFEPSMRVRHFGRTTLRALAAHQHSFGYTRAMLGLSLTPARRRLGKHALLAPAVAMIRISYLARCGIRWRPSALVKMMLFSPILIFAMAAWCRGFYTGSREWAAAGNTA